MLHNFFWHERWTWRSRPSGTTATLLTRLGHFHLLNGTISLTGNLAVMRLLTGSLHVDPLGANIAAIIVCSLLNFGASELLVFRRAAVVALLLLAIQPLAAAGDDGPAPVATEMLAVDLQPRTIQAWQAYEQRVDTRYESGSVSASPFFSLDAFGVGGWRSTAMGGGVAMSRIERARPGDGTIRRTGRQDPPLGRRRVRTEHQRRGRAREAGTARRSGVAAL